MAQDDFAACCDGWAGFPTAGSRSPGDLRIPSVPNLQADLLWWLQTENVSERPSPPDRRVATGVTFRRFTSKRMVCEAPKVATTTAPTPPELLLDGSLIAQDNLTDTMTRPESAHLPPQETTPKSSSRQKTVRNFLDNGPFPVEVEVEGNAKENKNKRKRTSVKTRYLETEVIIGILIAVVVLVIAIAWIIHAYSRRSSPELVVVEWEEWGRELRAEKRNQAGGDNHLGDGDGATLTRLACSPSPVAAGGSSQQTFDFGSACSSLVGFSPRCTATLAIVKCEIADIEENVLAGISSLWMLALDYNKLTHIRQNWFSGLKSLHTLSLSNNEIVRVDAGSFIDLGLLVILNLENNPLQTVDPDWFPGLQEIAELHLESGSIPLDAFQYLDGLSDYILKQFSSKIVTDQMSAKKTNNLSSKEGGSSQQTFDLGWLPNHGLDVGRRKVGWCSARAKPGWLVFGNKFGEGREFVDRDLVVVLVLVPRQCAR
ncbi:Plexin domain-containing protein 2 [Branchiostoma belcheri]|nr:Plexin domain-containing protein 2 [Branchiostoma belcheri]